MSSQLQASYQRVITLEGHLGKDCYPILVKTVHRDFEGGQKIIVDARSVSIDPEGVDNWLTFVHTYLMEVELCYRESQLSTVLQYTEDYRHPYSSFMGQVL